MNQSFIPDNLRKQESDVIYLVPFRSEELGDLLIYHRRPTGEREVLMDIVSQTLAERSQTEEVADMPQTIAEYFIQEGEKRGEKRGERRGERRGEKRGEKRGELRAKREAVLKLLQFRFDSIPSSVEKKIKSVRSVDRLNTLFEQAATVNSISDIEIMVNHRNK